MRMYNQLEPSAKYALNQAFLVNIKSGRNHQTFHTALHHYVNQSNEKKKAMQAINEIFPSSKFLTDQKQKAQVKTITRAYLKQTESSANRSAIQSKMKKKSNSRERNSIPHQMSSSQLKSAQKEAAIGHGLANRPPLATAQKSNRKRGGAVPLPPSIKLESQASTAFKTR